MIIIIIIVENALYLGQRTTNKVWTENLWIQIHKSMQKSFENQLELLSSWMEYTQQLEDITVL